MCFFVATGFSFFPGVFENKAQLALVIDFSKSSEKTIEALTQNYWELYTEFRAENPFIEIEIALVGYARKAFNGKNNYVKIISDFKDRPEIAFEYLVHNVIGSSVAENNVGYALDMTLQGLSWNNNESVKKQIFTIGNGAINSSFSLAKKVCEKAKNRNIKVNFLYLLHKDKDKNFGYWKTLKKMSGGKLRTLVSKYLVGNGLPGAEDNIARIIKENAVLNNTYVYYGADGKQNYDLMNEIDSKSIALGDRVISNRTLYKSSPFFQGKNADWDLVDFVNSKKNQYFKLKDLIVSDVYKNMSETQLKESIFILALERKKSLQIINKLYQGNLQINASRPIQPAFKKDFSETILSIFSEDGF